jgi:hypothetical protein
VDRTIHERLCAAPGAETLIDLEAQTVDGLPFIIDPFARYRLLRVIDELDFLLDQRERIEDYERRCDEQYG